MEIQNDNKEEKVDIVELVSIGEKRAVNGSTIIRLTGKLKDGSEKIYSNWKSVYDKIGFNERKANKGDILMVKYVESASNIPSYVFNHFVAIQQVPTDTLNYLSACGSYYAKQDELPF